MSGHLRIVLGISRPESLFSMSFDEGNELLTPTRCGRITLHWMVSRPKSSCLIRRWEHANDANQFLLNIPSSNHNVRVCVWVMMLGPMVIVPTAKVHLRQLLVNPICRFYIVKVRKRDAP